MIERSEFDYLMLILKGALAKGVRIPDGDGEMRIVDPEAVMGAMEAAWESLVPSKYRK